MKQLPLLKKSMLLRIQRGIAIFGTIGLVLMSFPVGEAQAAGLTSVKDTLSRAEVSLNANHTISFVSPSAVANAATITLTFPSDFSLTGLIEDDIDIAGSTEGELTTAADCTGAENASFSFTGQVITFTLCTGDGGNFTGSETITIEIGNHAGASGTGTNQINNTTTNGSKKIDIGGTMADSGSFAVGIVTDDSVNITATVDPSITFSISDVLIGFGTLTSGAVRYATGDATGGTTEATAAHTITLGTNGTNGMVLTYLGATLTAGADTIDVASNISPPGSAGSEQFAIAFDDGGSNFTIGATYDQVTPKYTFVAATTTQVMSSAGPVASTVIDTHYLANISSATEAGSYATDLTYIATATF